MRVIELGQLSKINKIRKQKIRKRKIIVVWFLFVTALSAGCAWLYMRPLPVIEADQITPTPISVTKSTIAWPENGQGAIGAPGYGVLDSSGQNQAFPTASVAKVMTALAVLRQKPLKLGEQGPIITLTADDVALYNKYLERDGSVVPVNEGEEISEYQMLQAVLLPSANNLANTLAIWAFGSIEGYLQYANNYAKELGMNKTNFADASGFSGQTVSTASDLVLMGIVAMNQPVISEIVSQKEAILPLVGLVKNINYLLGQNEIIGIKTGNTEEAGGCFLFAIKHKYFDKQEITLVGAIINASNLQTAMQESLPIIKTAVAGFKTVKVIEKSQLLGKYKLPWGGVVDAVAQNELSLLVWQDEVPKYNIILNPINKLHPNGSLVGTVEIQTKTAKQTESIITRSTVAKPSWQWKLIRY